MRITLLALPAPGPVSGATLPARAWLSHESTLGSDSPRNDRPPMRMKSRRVRQSQVSLPVWPGMTSMVQSSADGPLRGGESQEANSAGKHSQRSEFAPEKRANRVLIQFNA